MFSDEVAVTYPPAAQDHWQASAFVPRSFVRAKDAHHGEVMVTVLIKDGTRYAVLPSDQRDIVRVESSDLSSR